MKSAFPLGLNKKGRVSLLAAILILIAAAVGLAYGGVLEHGFFLAWDDNVYVSENPHIKAFGLSHLYWMATAFHACNWHPLTWFSHALDYALWGLDPWGHHLGNVALHLANSLLVLPLTILLLAAAHGKPPVEENQWLTVSRRTLLAGVASGLLFAVHPQHVEAVAWISERKELLCTFFYPGLFIKKGEPRSTH